MKKYIYLVILFLYAMGVIGGIGYTLYCNEYVIAVAVAVLGAMAYPTAKELYKKIME